MFLKLGTHVMAPFCAKYTKLCACHICFLDVTDVCKFLTENRYNVHSRVLFALSTGTYTDDGLCRRSVKFGEAAICSFRFIAYQLRLPSKNTIKTLDFLPFFSIVVALLYTLDQPDCAADLNEICMTC